MYWHAERIDSYAEMASEEKNKISHRGRALEKLEKYLKSLNA